MINKAKLGQVSNDVELEKQNAETSKIDENKNKNDNKKNQETNANSNNKKPPAANGKKVVKTVLNKVIDPAGNPFGRIMWPTPHLFSSPLCAPRAPHGFTRLHCL